MHPSVAFRHTMNLRLWRTCVVLAALITALILGLYYPQKLRPFAVEVQAQSESEGVAQVFYDRGQGFREEDSARVPLRPNLVQTYRFDLPPGKLFGLRLDLLDRPGRMRITRLLLRDPAGRMWRVLDGSDFTPNHEATWRALGPGDMELISSGSDPWVNQAFHEPLDLKSDWITWSHAYLPGITTVFLLALLALWTGGILWKEDSLARVNVMRRQYPRAALAAVAGIATVLACYPLIFMGRSLVSPNYGTALLYQGNPSVPAITNLRLQDAKGADVGAMMWQSLPYSAIEHDALCHDGELPLWDRYASCGVSLIGQGQSMVGDPFHLPVVLADAASWAFDLKFILLRALFACGLSWTVWALRRDWAAAAVVALGGVFIGFFNFRINHPAIFSVCYAPWVLCAWAHLITAQERRAVWGWAVGLLAANGCLLTSGTVKEAYMLLAAINAAGAASLLFTRDIGGLKVNRVFAAALSGLAVTLLTAPVWLTFADTVIRAYTSSDVPAAWRIPPPWLVGFFDDIFFRQLSDERRVFTPAMNLLFASGILWCLVSLRRQLADSIVRWLVIAFVVALLVAVDWLPSAWLLRVPGLRNVQHLHNTFSCIALIFGSVLAGCGFAAARRWLAAPARQWIWPGCVFLVIPGWLLKRYFDSVPGRWHTAPNLSGWMEKLPENSFFYSNILLMAASIVLLHGLAARYLVDRRITTLRVVGVGLALAVLLGRHGLQPAVYIYSDYYVSPPARAVLNQLSPAIRWLQAAVAKNPGRVLGFEDNLLPEFNAVYGLESPNGPDAVMNRHYRELVTSAGLVLGQDWRMRVDRERLRILKPMLDMLNVRFLLAGEHLDGTAPGYIARASLDFVVYESPSAWPRAFFVDTVVPYSIAPEIVERARARPGQPFAAVVTSDLARQSALRQFVCPAAEPVVVPAVDYRLTNNTTSFTVRAPSAGIVVLDEAWMKGDFRVTINGTPTKYFRVNHAFKGILIDAPGTYRVKFAYWPRDLTFSLWMAAAGAVPLLALLRLALGCRPATAIATVGYR